MLPFFLKLFTNDKPPPDDQELLRLYRETGEIGHLGELFQRHSEMVYLVCLKYLKDEDDSKDATMQLFEYLTEAARKHKISNFKSWIYVTAKNHCLMQLRANSRKPHVPLPEFAPELMEYHEPMHLTEGELTEKTEQVLRLALQELPPEQQKCITLFYLEQKSYKEIAELTACELNKVKSYIQNGKRNLKLYMEKHHEQR
ncbi:RNA polymerase sigma factor [Pontibacter sp. MBLB2868]|uniref:RNA polymerase sigma factor n=1 Tax=Pontibacter sp. MBLB2868 TaxID=3451555 RepID=UPI003F752292